MTSTIYLLNLAAKRAEHFYAAEAQAFGVTLPQYAILAALAKSDGLRLVDLIVLTGIDRSTMSDVVARLVQRKLVSRYTALDDKRALIVTLSPTGRQVFEAMKPHVRRADEAVSACFGPTHGKTVMFALELLLEHFPDDKEIE